VGKISFCSQVGRISRMQEEEVMQEAAGWDTFSNCSGSGEGEREPLINQ